MYIRIKKQKNRDGEIREYLCIAQTYRHHGKVRQKTIANLGRVDELNEKGFIERMAQKLAEISGKLELVNLAKDIKSEWAKHYGVIEVLKAMWKKLDVSRVLFEDVEKSDKEFAVEETICAMVINRLVKPSSKLETWKWKDTVWHPAWDSLGLQHFYRALDYLVEHKDAIEESLLNRRDDLFGKHLDLVLFDTTTVKYWGTHSDSVLLKHGYSKEKRMDLKQIIIGVLMSKDGLPLAHEVWEGNQSDIESMKRIVSKLKDRFDIGKVIIVCDRGMVSNKNLKDLEEKGYEYIVGVKMRQFDEPTKRELLGNVGFEEIREDLFVKEKKHEGRRYLVCYNPIEAKYEAENREYFKRIVERKVMDYSFKDWVVKNGYRKYIKLEGKDFQITMDYERLDEEQVFDGKWVLLTNTEFTSKECALYYKSLWQIEQGFRTLKSEIETGPIYHWTTKRIRGHVFICFLALLLKTALVKELEKIDPKAVYSEVIRALKAVKATKVLVKNKELILRAQLPEKAHLGFKAAGIRIPGDVLSIQQENVVPTSA